MTHNYQDWKSSWCESENACISHRRTISHKKSRCTVIQSIQTKLPSHSFAEFNSLLDVIMLNISHVQSLHMVLNSTVCVMSHINTSIYINSVN